MFVRHETAYFVTFSLPDILNISCRHPCTKKSFQADLFSHTPFSNKIIDRCIFETTFSSGDSSLMSKPCRNINATSSKELHSLHCELLKNGFNLMTKNFLSCCSIWYFIKNSFYMNLRKSIWNVFKALKQPFAGVLQHRWFWKFCKIDKNTHVVQMFSWEFHEILSNTSLSILKNTSGRMILKIKDSLLFTIFNKGPQLLINTFSKL